MHDEWYVCETVEIYADFRFGGRVSYNTNTGGML